MSRFGISRRGLGVAGAAALVATLSACGNGSPSATPAAGSISAPAAATPTVAEPATALKSMSTPIGAVLLGPTHRTVYELVGDTAAKPTCTGGCLAIWPPVDKNGSQVTVNGHPAFTYVGDAAPGQTKGQGVTDAWGHWLALDASGHPISSSGARTSSPSSTTSPNGGGSTW